MLEASLLALEVRVEGSIWTLANAACNVSPVINPLSPALAVPVPNFSLHFLASSVEMLEASLLAFAFNVVGSICTVDKAACKVSPVTSPVLPAAFFPVPNAACQAVLLIAPSFASDTFHNWLPLIASLEFSEIVPSVTFTNFLVEVLEPMDTTSSSVATLSLPRITELLALVVTLDPNTKVFVPTVCVVVESPMVLLLPNA